MLWRNGCRLLEGAARANFEGGLSLIDIGRWRIRRG